MFKVGSLIKLKEQCLGNPHGTVGYVYETYIDYNYQNQKGISIIFPNGNYDGFSYNDQHIFIDPEFNQETDFKYEFKNVMKLSYDFNRGFFNKVLNIESNLYK